MERDKVNSNQPINQERKEIKSQSAKKSKNQLKYSRFKDGEISQEIRQEIKEIKSQSRVTNFIF